MQRLKGPQCCRSPSQPSSASSDCNSSSSEEGLVEGKRQRTRIDYVAMNSQMFGDEDEDDSDQDYGKSRKQRRKMS